ncbi:MAG: hypothetical protein HYY17_00600 [Planctomycetes bacterium]|nr:hypothetical protein [Planctomycetota bacterium]
MSDAKKGFGEQLFQRLQSKGLSKAQIYKVLALQRLSEEVSELGAKGLLSEGHLLEISKVAAAARQKQIAEIAVEKNLSVGWVKEISKLVRAAEKAPTERDASRYWDFFFELKESLDREGPTKRLLDSIRNFGREKPAEAEAAAPGRPAEDRAVVSFGKLPLELGRGLDVGTVNICAAAKRVEGEPVFNIQRNAFLDVRSDTFTKKMLMKLGIDYIVQNEKGYVIGDPAFELANIFEKNTRRPMKDGMISPVEPEALLIVSLLIAQLVGTPLEVGEVCAFSVPADPVDAERNVIYHRGALEAVLRKLGYTPKPVLEGHAVVFAELPKEDYTGIGVSCGGGMFNVCVAYKSVPALTFSTSRGGDWIDQNVSLALGMPVPQVCAVKESGVDLRKPRDRVEDAIVIYYRNLIQYTLEMIKQKFGTAQNMPTFSRPIEIVCAGGTSLVLGFIDVFREEFEKIQFPIEVKGIRLARDPLRAIAEGCLDAAIEETKALKEIQKSTEVMIARAEVTKETKFDDTTRRLLRPRPADEKAASAVPLSRGDTGVRHLALKPDAERILPAAPPPEPAEVPLEEVPEIEEASEPEETEVPLEEISVEEAPSAEMIEEIPLEEASTAGDAEEVPLEEAPAPPPALDTAPGPADRTAGGGAPHGGAAPRQGPAEAKPKDDERQDLPLIS